MASIYKSINELGYLLVGYSAIKILGAEPAILLCRLLDEWNFALKHKNNCGWYFLVNVYDLSELLYFSAELIKSILNEFSELKFLQYWQSCITDSYIMCLDINKIKEYIKITEKKEMFTTWDYRLNDTQIGKNKILNYSPSTEKLLETVYANNTKANTTCLALCDYLINQFEKQNQKSFWNIKGKDIENYFKNYECSDVDVFNLICKYTREQNF